MSAWSTNNRSSFHVKQRFVESYVDADEEVVATLCEN